MNQKASPVKGVNVADRANTPRAVGLSIVPPSTMIVMEAGVAETSLTTINAPSGVGVFVPGNSRAPGGEMDWSITTEVNGE